MTRTTPTRPRPTLGVRDAAEAVFKPVAKLPDPEPKTVTVPGAKESVTLRLDQAVLAHFQEAGAGWQDRINEALRQAAGLSSPGA